ncbi:MAG: hypothetical protein GY716_15585 [bacterium]|nr:hypothetical protein [bacterium]
MCRMNVRILFVIAAGVAVAAAGAAQAAALIVDDGLPDGGDCEGAALGGSWDAPTATCTSAVGFSLGTLDRLIVRGAATLTNEGFVLSEGAVTVEAGATLTNEGTFENEGVLRNVGDVTNVPNATFRNRGAVISVTEFVNGGDLFNDSGALFANYVRLFVLFGSIVNNGTIVNLCEAVVTGPGVIGNAPQRTVRLLLDETSLTWCDAPAQATFDVVRGSLSGLRAAAGAFPGAVEQCMAADTSAQSVPHGAAPADAWFVVREASGGTYHSGGSGQIDPRDGDIDISIHACP